MATDEKRSFIAVVALQHGKRLKRFLSQRLRNRVDAPDLAQEVYLRLLRAERHDQIRNPEAYLLTIASHLLQEHTVRQANGPPIVNLDDIMGDLHPIAADDPAAAVETQQRMRAVEGVLGKLSPKARAVLMLHRCDGFSLEEIGEQLGLSRSMAKKYLAQALSQCRQRLERLERQPGRPHD